MSNSGDIDSLMTVLGYHFKSRELLTLALTHRSKKTNQFAKKANMVVSYERLEFLGDAVLGLAMAKHLYNSHSDKQEGQLTRMRATLVREETLVEVAKLLRIGQYLILGAGEIKAGGRQRDSILADVVEAILGAIYLDCNEISIIEKLIINWFSVPLKQVDSVDTVSKLKDSKSRLQEYLQSKGLPLPSYELEHVTGKAPKETFTVQCEILDDTGTVQKDSATGKSRRIAEQNVAKLILEQITETQ